MRNAFNIDFYSGRPKILFIGFGESTHTHAWIDLLKESRLNVRLFALHSMHLPSEHWNVKTYVTTYTSKRLDPRNRRRLYPAGKPGRFCKRMLAQFLWGGPAELEEYWLARIISQWRPDIIHTLGLEPAGYLYARTRDRFKLAGIGKWVLQLRGGSDLSLSRLDPERSEMLATVIRQCTQLISDNVVNIHYVKVMGVKEEQIASLTPVPGTGGVDISTLVRLQKTHPVKRRLILWPKAYDSPWSLALPVFEAIKMSWERLQPCQIQMLAMTESTRMWYWALPQSIRQHCHMTERVPRQQVFELMAQARVMLAPSLVDGIPNTMFEAMATGTFPIVSPLETIRTVVEHEKNVLFARNLYPHEIADALCRAMTDDTLVDQAAESNLTLVRNIADREILGPRIIEYYERLAKEPTG